MFMQAAVFLNEVLVTPANNQYAYRSYFDTLLSYNKEIKKSQAQCELYFTEKDPTNVVATTTSKDRFR